MLNMAFELPVVIDTHRLEWLPSPKVGVWRRQLAREEQERGHATSIVRYDAGARFSAHDHPLGEEILVLQGVFSDHTGDYPAGTYFRNPEGFRHAPFSEAGCTILVKLHQFQAEDNQHLTIDTSAGHWSETPVERQRLHQFGDEVVELQRWPAATTEPIKANYGEELYIIEGSLADSEGSYAAGSWIRTPQSRRYHTTRAEGALVWRKSGHFGSPAGAPS